MSKSMNEVRDDVLHRICRLIDTRTALVTAAAAYEDAITQIDEAWDKWDDVHRIEKKESVVALAALNGLVMKQVAHDLYATATQAGFLIANYVIAPVAQESDVAVVALTGNSYVPPLRDIEDAEVIWQADDQGDVWETFVEALENNLDKLGIDMGSPDYDNMLYVVDRNRWVMTESDGDYNAWLDNSYYTKHSD